MRTWLVREVDGTSMGGIPVLRGHVEAETKEEATAIVGEPSNSWNSYTVGEVEPFVRIKEAP